MLPDQSSAGKPLVIDDYECILLNLLDDKYTRHPFFGSRKMTVWLRDQGHNINRKRVQRLMRVLGLVRAAMVPGPNTVRNIHKPDLSLLAQRLSGYSGQSGLEYRHNVYSFSAGLYVFGGHPGLV